jgi:toxin ParE1/3/4
MFADRAIIFTLPLATVDVIALWTIIAEDGLAHADRLLDLLAKKLRMLAEVPAIGQERSDLAPSLRSFPFGDYRIFFRPIDGGIEVVRILHESCDTASPFPGDLI